MSRDYKKMLRHEGWHFVRWLPVAVLGGLVLMLALRLLEPPAMCVQTVRSHDGRFAVRLEKQRYVRRNDWVVRIHTGFRWRTVFYWIPTEKEATHSTNEPRLVWSEDAHQVSLVLDGRVLWSYAHRRSTED